MSLPPSSRDGGGVATPQERSVSGHVCFHLADDDDQDNITLPRASGATTADDHADEVNTSTAPGGPGPQASPDASSSPELDYEHSGQGFVPRASLQRQLSARSSTVAPAGVELARRSRSFEEKQAALVPVVPGAVSINMAAAGAESEGVTVADKDAIWLLSLEQVAAEFPDTELNVANVKGSRGLTAAEAASRLARDGRNELRPPPEHSELVKYLLQFTDPFNILLTLAGILSAVVAYPLDTENVINLYLGIVLWVVVILSATFAYLQEGRASNVMKSFKNMLPSKAKVIRDGRVQEVNAVDLVVGDLLQVGTGDIVPADMRLVWTQDCKVETSSLTGESLPITCALKSPGTLKMEQARNMVFNSSKCLEGESWGVVVATGDNSLIGQIAGLAGATKGDLTPLQKEITLFVKYLSIAAICLGIIFFVIGMARGSDWIFAFINGFVVVLIACVPQGLPITVVSCLTITSRRLSDLNVFVKQLSSVETLGSVTCIASDKTGTLTQNIMAVANVWFDLAAHTADSVFQHYPPHSVQRKVQPGQNNDGGEAAYHRGATLEQLELIAIICSKTRFEDERQLTADQARQLETIEVLKGMDPGMTMRSAKNEYPTVMGRLDPGLSLTSGRSKLFQNLSSVMLDDSQRKVVGDASETALFNFVRQRQSIELLRFHHQKVYDVPFNSRNKFALTVTKPVGLANESPNRRTLLMKGAPEVVLARCSHYMLRGEKRELDERFKEEFKETYERFGNMGQRVLGFASLDLPEDKFGAGFDARFQSESDKVPTSGLVFAGLISLVDPPKESVPQSVLDCRSAGIKVIMVTGDHPLTAAAIARQVNIFPVGHFTREELAQLQQCPAEDVDEDEVDCVVVTGPELAGFSEGDWARVLGKEGIVFARTTPQDKLTIVTRLQGLGHIVAATGDGVNDSPALKKADIGVAMGINGSDVARDAAAVILMDDNFASIVVGVREGRTIFSNIQKTVAYTCSHLWPEAVPVLLTLAFSFPLALSSLLILTVDLFTEMAPAVSIAYEPSEGDVMRRPPRNAKKDRLVSWQLVGYCLTQAGIIETLGCLLGFFLVFEFYGVSASSLYNTPYFQGIDSPDMPVFPGCKHLDDGPGPFAEGSTCFTNAEQETVLRQAQTCYFMLLTTAQFFHVFLVKTRNASVFTHGLFRNPFTLWAVAIEACIIMLIIFAPSSHTILTSEVFPARFWALLVLSPFVIGLWQEGRKAWVRRYPAGFIARKIHW